MAGLSIDVVSDICDQVGAWQRAFLSEASLDRCRRACAWSMSEVAKAAAAGGTDAIDAAFENPTPWMRKAFGYTRALTRSGDTVGAATFVKPSQSITLKYGLGDGPQIRRPGDVGLAKDRILVPHWCNLALTQGINRNAYGNVPGGVAARLAREALGQRAKRRVTGRWGVYKGEIDAGGSRIMGYSETRPPSASTFSAAQKTCSRVGIRHSLGISSARSPEHSNDIGRPVFR